MNPGYRIFLFPFLFLFLTAERTFAQQDGINPQFGNAAQDTIDSGIMPLDTPVPMTYILLGDLSTSHSFTDSYQWEDNKHFPLGLDGAHLGNYGSAYRTMTPSAAGTPIGFSTGWLQYEPYFLHVDSFRYYNQDVPVTKVEYSQGGQEDTYLTFDFGRSFAQGLSLSIAYRRLNQVGEFNHQRQKDTGFSVGVWHNAPNGRYDAFYNYLSNAAVTEENGGVVEPDSIGRPLNPDAGLETFIQAGISNHKHRSFLTRQIIHFAPDTARFGFDVWMQAQFETGLFKYVDEEAIFAADYYGSEYLVDDRGIRQYTFETENQWSLGISLPWKAAHSNIDASIRYRGIKLDQEPTTRNINEVFVDLNGEFQWIEPLLLRGTMSLGLGQAEGAFSFRAEGILKIGVLGHLRGDWNIVARNPYMVETALYVTQLPVYSFSFDNPLINEIGVSWQIPKQQFQAGIKWMVFDKFIYFDSNSFPQQLDGSFSVQRFFISKDITFKSLGLKGSLIWQPDPKKELAIPELLYSASIYGKIPVFKKKVTIMTGMDFSYHGGFTGVSYFPVNGRYHLTSASAIPDYFRMDISLGLKINFIKAYARFEDFAGLFSERVLYEADFYPHYRGYFRLGLEAGFYN